MRLPVNIGTILLSLVVATSCGGNRQADKRGTTPAAGGQARPPIIDVHMHSRMSTVNGGTTFPRPCAPEPCVWVESPDAQESVLRRTLGAMDRYNVVIGYLSDYYTTGSVDAWAKEAPGRFLPSVIPFSSDGLLRGAPDTAALRSAYTSNRFKGMGEITAQYFGIAPNDPRLEPYYSLAEELNVPVLIHTAGIGAPAPRFRASLGNPLLLEDVIVRHPKLRLFVAHAGYPFLEETIALMTYYPQVYVDLSAITWFIPRSAFHRYLRGLVDAGLEKRLMLGSDSQEWPETIGISIEAIESAEFLTADQKRDIFYNNAARFLRLEAPVSH